MPQSGPLRDKIMKFCENQIEMNKNLNVETKDHRKRAQSAKSSEISHLIKSESKSAKIVYIPIMYVK
jgi:hypothetical protein